MSKTNDTRTDELIQKLGGNKECWDDDEDETDHLLSKAIEMAIDQGKGWKEGEREAYMDKMLDDDYLSPLFATSPEELEKSGLADAFEALTYDDPPAQTMNTCKKKGNEAFLNGKRNVAKNIQVSN